MGGPFFPFLQQSRCTYRACCFVVSISFSRFLARRMEKAGHQMTANWSDHRWRCVSRAWVVQASECHVFLGALLKCGFPNNTFVPESLPCFYFTRHALIIKVSNAVRDREHKRPYLKTLCKASIKKRKCYLLLLPHPLICAYLPFRPGDMLFSFKAAVWNRVQWDLLCW